MNPGERILGALTGKKIDYTPCAPIFWADENFWKPVQEINVDVDPELNHINDHIDSKYRWNSLEEQIDIMINSLGVDPVLHIDVSFSNNLKDVEEKIWTEKREEHTILHKEYNTPSGILSASVDLNHWPLGNDIPFFTDWVTNFTEYWVSSVEDIEKLKHVLLPPVEETIKRDIEANRKIFSIAEKYQLPVYSYIGKGLTGLLQLMGAENACFASIEKPEIIESYLEYEHFLNMKRMEITVDFGVDFFGRNGFYETCDFYSPIQLVARLRSSVLNSGSK